MKLLAFFISFVLAFLLFSVQPMATKMVLPTLGGTPAVWNTAMLSFQLLLLLGYAYAHVLNTRVPGPRQWQVHALVVAASLFLLPLTVSLQSSEEVLHAPIYHLALAFFVQAGLPFFVLSATAPLLQAWVARSNSPLKETPYVLYSASNLGSLLGLLGYVALVEPSLSLPQQSLTWSVAYVLGTAALLFAGYRLASPNAVNETAISPAPIGKLRYVLWIWLAFLPSSLSLGVTSYITTDIAAVPLLWVIPLALYLLSYVDAFRTRPLLVPGAMRVAPVLGMVALLLYGFQGHRYSESFLFQLLAFFALALALHGWLARFKPEPSSLTRFYFSLSIGGALGGVFNAIVAPWLFTETFEYPLSLLAAGLTGFFLWERHGRKEPAALSHHLLALGRVMVTVIANTAVFYFIFAVAASDWEKATTSLDRQLLMMAASFAAFISLMFHRRYVQAFYACSAVGIILLVAIAGGSIGTQMVFKARNFFGVEKVYDQKETNTRTMLHNTTVHGVQPITFDGPPPTTSYYRALTSSFANLKGLGERPLAVIGLGVGTVQCFARPDQQVDFFEINPLVAALAEDKTMFRYLSDCPGTHRILLGDGRIKMAQQDDRRYGGIVLDAFSSDAIPAHLLTREALKIYFDKLADGGVLMLHSTNRHIDLWPLIAAQTDSLGAVAYGKYFTPTEGEALVYSSYWVVMARQEKDIAPLLKNDPGWSKLAARKDARPWTDQYTNILPYFKALHSGNDIAPK